MWHRRIVTMCLLTACVVVGIDRPQPVAAHAVTDLVGPAGSGRFGDTVIVLPNGNIVVRDPQFDAATNPTTTARRSLDQQPLTRSQHPKQITPLVSQTP